MTTDTSVTINFERCYPFGLPPAGCPQAAEANRFAAEPHAGAEIVVAPAQPTQAAQAAGLAPLNRLQPGSATDYRTADDLVSGSHGRLVWAQDRHDHWWVVRREDRRHVEHARHGYHGPGLRYGDGNSPVSDRPVDLDDIQYLRGAGSSLCGWWPGARVALRSGQSCSVHVGQSLVDQSNAQLSWAQDGRGDWWAVLRGDRDAVERCLRNGSGFSGGGVRLLDRSMRGQPVGDSGIDWLNAASTPYVGGMGASFMLQPGVDTWTMGLGQRLAGASGGLLSLLQDNQGNAWLAQSEMADGFDAGAPWSGGGIQIPWDGAGGNYQVQAEQLDWINSMMQMRSLLAATTSIGA